MMLSRLVKVYQLSKHAFGGHKKSILFLTLLGFLNGTLAGIGINTLIPIFSFVSGNNNILGADKISRLIQNLFVFFGINFSLKYLLVFVCILFIIQSIVLLFSNYFIASITADYERSTRDLLLSKILRADWSYLLKQKIGYLETVIANDVKNGSVVLTSVSGLIITLTSLLMYVVVAVSISLEITIVTFIFGIVYLIITRPLLIRTKRAGRKTAAMYKDVSHFVNENVGGMKTVKVFTVEDSIIAVAKEKFQYLRDLRVEVAMLSAIGGSVIQPLSIVFIGVLFAVYYKSPVFNIGAFLALVYLIQKIFLYFNQLQSTLQKAIEAVPYLQSVLSFEDKAREFKEEIGGNRDFVFSDLVFNQVNFSYNESRKVLQNINFTLKKGEVVGLIGPSGSGKTTLVDLILRLFLPTSGNITLDGTDISEVNIKEWRDKIGYVSQDMFLINDTIENNIRFYNKSLSITDLESVSRLANIYDFIMNRLDSFNTIIGERGNLLSVGQRQRIVIARVLARKPEILILDEATSALDNETEMEIQRVINNLKGKVTVLIIAHRLSTVMGCDHLLVLENGKIVEEGKPRELLENGKSYFYRVYNS